MFQGARAVRLEINEDGSVDLMRIDENGRPSHFTYPDVDPAVVVAKLLLKAGREIVLKNKFEPALFKEARKEFKKLEERAKWERQGRIT